MKQHLLLALAVMFLHSCIPLRIAPTIKDYKITQGKKFKSGLPKKTVFVFEDPKDADEFYHYVNTKYQLDDYYVDVQVPLTIKDQTFYFSFYEVEIPTKTINLVPLALDVALSRAADMDPMFEDAHATRIGNWYIAIEIFSATEEDCLSFDSVSRELVLSYLRDLKKEYLATDNYNELVLKTKDFSVSGEEFELHHDQDLDMLVTKPQPESLDLYYESEDYISHTDAQNTFTDRLYQFVKRRNLQNKIQVVDNQVNKPINLLDIGAGTGDFVLTAKKHGFEAFGVEPNNKARELALKKGVGLSAKIEEINTNSFQVITLWHVLEHLPELEKDIKTLVGLLEEDGVMVIAVPNFKSYDANHYGSFWAGYDVPRHLWHFSKTAIAKIFAAHQMEVVKIRPMLFDAFYVSMLSEKYKGNKLYLIKAFFIGLWSNLSAFFTKEHSSLIYILKKKK